MRSSRWVCPNIENLSREETIKMEDKTRRELQERLHGKPKAMAARPVRREDLLHFAQTLQPASAPSVSARAQAEAAAVEATRSTGAVSRGQTQVGGQVLYGHCYHPFAPYPAHAQRCATAARPTSRGQRGAMTMSSALPATMSSALPAASARPPRAALSSSRQLPPTSPSSQIPLTGWAVALRDPEAAAAMRAIQRRVARLDDMSSPQMHACEEVRLGGG